MNDETVQQWVIDVQDWAEHGRCLIISVFKLEQTTDLATLHYTMYIKITVAFCCSDSPAGSSDSLLEVRRRIEENSLGLRQRRACLYSHTGTHILEYIKSFKNILTMEYLICFVMCLL